MRSEKNVESKSENAGFESEFTVRRLRDVECFEHIHFNAEVAFVIDGAMIAKTEKQEHLLTRGNGILIMPYKMHNYKTKENVDTIVIEFSPTLIEEFINIYAVSDSVFELSPQIIEYILSIVKSKTKNTLLQKAILYPIIYSVFASNRNDFEQKSSGKIFQDALNYISENYSSEITLNTAAKAIGCSYSYLSRVFAQSTNISFTEYLNRYRILKSITPLKGSDVTVTEIAFECGFSTLRSYNREFKKYLKVTPKEYRRNGFDYFVVESEL